MYQKLHAVAHQVGQIVVGKDLQVRQALTCLLAGGHLLVEDVPGVGKTTLAHALAISLGLQFNRVQFTSDLLPADVAGISVYEREKNGFV
ncbi:MAG: AAA family ATPase, partial [Telluria sp.]